MELHRPWWYWRVMSLKSKIIRTVIFLQGRRRGSGGGGWRVRGKQGLVNYYNPRLLTGRWDKFCAVEDTGSRWFLKPCGFRPKKDNLSFLFVPSPVSGLTQGPQSKFESRGMWGGRVGGTGTEVVLNWIRPLDFECEGVRGACSRLGKIWNF